MDQNNDYDFGSHLLHCRESKVTLHVTGETPEIVEERWKKGKEVRDEYCRSGKMPDALPQGIVLKAEETTNHGSGGP